jgi:hypothetical protein
MMTGERYPPHALPWSRREPDTLAHAADVIRTLRAENRALRHALYRSRSARLHELLGELVGDDAGRLFPQVRRATDTQRIGMLDAMRFLHLKLTKKTRHRFMHLVNQQIVPHALYGAARRPMFSEAELADWLESGGKAVLLEALR